MIITKHPMIFADVKKKLPNSSWLTHTPFAFFLISVLKPKIYVELGVLVGQSFHAFCQAAKTLQTDTRCYGIDTWQGDEHVPYYGEDIFKELNDYNEEHYKKFSTLMRMTFEEGLKNFKNGTIDLLHIDGYHTYEAVKKDFETWLPKLSTKAVVIFHDTFIKDSNFGVWKFWEEISKKYPSFEFYHGCGLGVLAVGKNVDKEFIDFLKDKKNHDFYRKFFSNLGKQVLTDGLYENLKDHIKRLLPFGSIRRRIAEKSLSLLFKLNMIRKSFAKGRLFKNRPAASNTAAEIDHYQETLKVIDSLPVPPKESKKRKCAIFVMLKNEKVFLPIWLKYYTQYFSGEDIYVFDHNTTDGSIDECLKKFNFNVIKLSYPYSFDHIWFKYVANNTQKKLLKSYEYVIFTDIDEIILPDKEKYSGLDDYLNKLKDDYVQCLGYDLIHVEKKEPNFNVNKTVLSQRKFWYYTSWYNKILISKHTVDWEIGFHKVKNLKPNIDKDLILIHLHKLDFNQCWDKSFNRARLWWLQKDIVRKRGWQNRITDIDEFRRFYYAWPDEIEIVEIPEKVRKTDAF